MNGHNDYSYIDISSSTNPGCFDNRRINPRGTCIHTTSGTDSLYWLTGGSVAAGTPAGADYLIKRTGEGYKLTPQGTYAYHAGYSRLRLERLYTNNEVSQVLLGVELECLDNEAPTWQQMDSLAGLIIAQASTWQWRWPLVYYGHYSVARPVGRRSDPVNMPWGDLAGVIYSRALAANLPGLVP